MIMAALVAALMLAWGALPALRYIASSAVGKDYEILQKPVSQQQLRNAAEELALLRQMEGVRQRYPLLLHFIEKCVTNDGGEGGADSDAVWRYLVLLRNAEAAGIGVSDEELGQIPPGSNFTPEIAANIMKLLKFHTFRLESSPINHHALWQKYNYVGHKVKVSYVAIPHSLFDSAVEVKDEEVRKFYEEHKDEFPDARAGRPGYKAPEMVRVEYVSAPVEDIAEDIDVSAEEIKRYYMENKTRFVAEEEKGDDSDDDVTEENGTVDDADETDQQGEPSSESEVTYQPLSEVEDEIRRRIAEERAREEAEDRAELARSELERVYASYVDRPLPLEQLGKRNGMKYYIVQNPAGNRYVTADEIIDLMPGGREVKRLVFEEDIEVNTPRYIETESGPVIFQVLERRSPRPRPFEEVKDVVRNDLIRKKAFGRAREMAERIKTLARDIGFENAVKRANEDLTELLGKLDTEGAKNGDDAGGRSGGDGGGEAENYLKIKQSGFISKGNPSLGSDDGCEDIVDEAMCMATGDVRIVACRGQGGQIYVIRKLEGKDPDPAGFQDWLEGWNQDALMKDLRLRFLAYRGEGISLSELPEYYQEVWLWLARMLEESPPPSNSGQ
jgi:hypothetical protein